MKDRTIEQVTVADICAVADVSRQTFYRYFADKYEVTTCYIQQLLEGAFDDLGETIGWHQAYLREFRNIEASVRSNPNALRGFVESDDYNSVVPSTGRSGLGDFSACFRRRYGKDPSELVFFQMRWFSTLASLVTTDWIRGGCLVAAEHLADMIVTLIPQELRESLDVDEARSGE